MGMDYERENRPGGEKEEKTCVVTGATSGIGFEIARQLAAKGMRIILMGRSAEKCRVAERRIRNEFPAAAVQHVAADFSSLQEVREAAGKIKRLLQGKPIDHLVHNAAMVSNWYIATAEGYELQFVVNYLSAFLLTHALLAQLAKSPDARIISVSSGSHRHTRLDWEDLMLRRRYTCLKAYKQSKLALVLFTHEFNRRFSGKRAIKALAIEPGLVDTDLGEKNTAGPVKLFWKLQRKRGMSAVKAAAAIVALCLERNPELRGTYWRCAKSIASSGYSCRPEVAAELWEKSESLCGISAFNNLDPGGGE